MRLLPTILAGSISGYPGLDLSGFLGIVLFSEPTVPLPFSYLHIDDGGTRDTGYRKWRKMPWTTTRT